MRQKESVSLTIFRAVSVSITLVAYACALASTWLDWSLLAKGNGTANKATQAAIIFCSQIITA